MKNNEQKQAISVKEFARQVGIGRTRLYVEIGLGRVKVLKSGQRSLIPVSEVQAFFERLEAAQTKAKESR